MATLKSPAEFDAYELNSAIKVNDDLFLFLFFFIVNLFSYFSSKKDN